MDIKEFENQINLHLNALKRLVYYKMPNKSDGDDVLQEALLSAFMHYGKLKNINSFKLWLFKIAANKCNDFYKSRARLFSLSMEEIPQIYYCHNKSNNDSLSSVNETLTRLGENDRQILRLYFLQGFNQAELSKKLQIPIGTVKSRLHKAKKRFSLLYPFSPKGGEKMKKLPKIMPIYSITESNESPFELKWEELPFWFIIPRLNEKATFGFYDLPEKKLTGTYTLSVTGKASVHGIEGVEINAQYKDILDANQNEILSLKPSKKNLQVFVVQLTDTHCRWLSESHYKDDVKCYSTFLDCDEFLPNWGYGEDNCGIETSLIQKGAIKKNGNIITADDKSLRDIVGRYNIVINKKAHDCVCVLDISDLNKGIVIQHFIDKNGRAVLDRRFNSDTWRLENYKQRWSEKLPNSDRLIINGETFVCWYECISDYVL